MYLKYFCILLGIQIATATSKHVKFYRKDYTYVFDYDAFYKLHVANNTSWNTAFLSCENEEAQLFYPSEADEWRIVNKLKKEMAETANVTDVLIGVHNKFGVGEFLTVDGLTPPVPLGDDLQRIDEGEVCVTMDSDTGSYERGHCTRRSPTLFVCKKLDNQKCLTPDCPTIDPDYKYSPHTKKCYKVNKNAKQWQEAMRTCYVEGGLLAVAEDTAGVERIRNMVTLSSYSKYFIGVRDLFKNGNYYTIKGKNIGGISLEEDRSNDRNEQNQYGPDPYNNDYNQERVTERQVFIPPRSVACGVISSNQITATSCYDAMPFICEMEANK